MRVTDWTEVAAWAQIAAAVGTFLYLAASVLLWLSTRRAAKAAAEQAQAANKAADAAREQAIQTASAVTAAREQAALAERQFALSSEMFVLENQPLLVFEQPPRFEFAAPGSRDFRVVFTVRNDGKVTATRVRWRVQLEVNGNHYKTFPPIESTEVARNQVTGSTVEGMVPGTVGAVPPASAVPLAMNVEVQYTNPLDQQVRHSMCEVRRDPQSGRVSFVPFIGRDIGDTPTTYCSGVPFP